MDMAILLASALGYLVGSIPIGLIVSRLAGGVDLRDFGSGRTGFTNSLRVLGLRRSLPVLAGDIAKGALGALLPLLYTDDPWARAAGGVAAVVGHVWPLFAGFRGGRGVLTGAGVLLALSPLAALLVPPPALLALYLTRYASLASIAGCLLAASVFSILAALDYHSWAYAAAAVAGGALIVAVHHDNIRRLLAGTERKLGQGGERRPPRRTAEEGA
jgi:glycerol-3-phosphate acyltransferase PlsY